MADAVPAETRLRRHAAWGIVVAAHFVTFPYFEALNNPNENVRLWTTRALVQHGTFAIDEVMRQWGEVSDRAVYGGRRFSGKAPGTSLLGVPVLWAETRIAEAVAPEPPRTRATAVFFLRTFTVALPLLFFLWVFARRVERETGSPWARDLLVLGLGIGTLLYPQGRLFVGHALAAALSFGAYLCVAEAQNAPRPRRSLALGGLLAGLAVVFEYQVFLVAGVVGAFALVAHQRRAAHFFLGAVGPAVLLGGYHAALFGRPWALPYAHLDDPIFREFHGQGLLGLSWPRLSVLWEAFFTVDYGLFVFSPFLAAGLLCAAVLLRGESRWHAAVVMAVTVTMALFLAGMSNWRGGWSAGGPRYIAAVAPFLAWAIALGWRTFWAPRPWRCVALAALVVVSVGLCGIAGAHFPHYPPSFDNPVFDVSVRLLGEGYAPRGFGTVLGFPGASAFAPAALVLLVAAALALGCGRRPARMVLASAALALVALGGLAFSGKARPDEARALEHLRHVWEPPRRGDGSL